MDDETDQLDLRALWLMLIDFSLDAPRRFYPSMGLVDKSDVVFSNTLQELMAPLRSPFTSDEHSDEIVPRAFEAAEELHRNGAARLHDWGRSVYPSATAHQTQIFRWSLVIRRGGLDGRRDVQRAPSFVRYVRGVLGAFPPVDTALIEPATERDQLYCNEKRDLGFSAFEWIESAVGNFRFGYAWSMALRNETFDPNQVYDWALAEAARLHFRPSMLDRPGADLELPTDLFAA